MKKDLLLIGGGGHCKSCIDVIECQDVFAIAGIIDLDSAKDNVLGYPFLGGDQDLEHLRSKYDYALITIGHILDSSVRARVYKNLVDIGYQMPAVISPRAYVSKHSTVGSGTIVMHNATLNAGAVVGNNCIINTNSLIEHDAIVGDDCHISTGAIINGDCRIISGTFVGSNAVVKHSAETKKGDFIKAGSLFKGYVND